MCELIKDISVHYRNFNFYNIEVMRRLKALKSKHPAVKKILDRPAQPDAEEYQLSDFTRMDQEHKAYLEETNFELQHCGILLDSTLMAAGNRTFQYLEMLKTIKKSLMSRNTDERNQSAWIDKVSSNSFRSQNLWRSCQLAIVCP